MRCFLFILSIVAYIRTRTGDDLHRVISLSPLYIPVKCQRYCDTFLLSTKSVRYIRYQRVLDTFDIKECKIHSISKSVRYIRYQRVLDTFDIKECKIHSISKSVRYIRYQRVLDTFDIKECKIHSISKSVKYIRYQRV